MLFATGIRMTLAAILLLSFSSASYTVPVSVLLPQSPQPSEVTQSQGTRAIQEQNGAGAEKPAEMVPPTTSGAKPKSLTRKAGTAKKVVHKNPAHKKTSDSGCENSVTADPAKGAGSSTSQTKPPDSSATQAANPQPPKNCPPEKIVVRQGGTSDPSIQLAGGDQESQKKNDANKMLGSTEANLKKISSIQLSPEQQETVTQIKQFVDQSKTALAEGDVERGHTLAWKAQLLSDDLVNPQK